MKKIYFLLVVLIFEIKVSAQHTLTAAFSPAVGDLESYIELDTTGLFLGSSGTSQTWNYTGISTGTNTPYSYTYVPMSSVPNNSLYPAGTLAADIGVGGIHYIYNNTSSTIEWLGSAYPSANNCGIYSDPQMLCPLPFTYGSFFSDTFIQTNPVAKTGSTSSTGDGTGTLQLPSGNFSNILKITSTYSEPGMTAIGNQYYSPISKFPLLTVWTITLSNSSGNTIYKSGKVNSSVASSVAGTLEDKAFQIFPNPVTNGELFLKSENNEKLMGIEITNTLGQVVNELQDKANEDGTRRMDISALQKGIYFLRIRTSQATNTKKIIIE